MSKFKVGQKVKCLDKGFSEFLEVGKVYTVSASRPSLETKFRVEEALERYPNHAYIETSFELVTPSQPREWQVGDEFEFEKNDFHVHASDCFGNRFIVTSIWDQYEHRAQHVTALSFTDHKGTGRQVCAMYCKLIRSASEAAPVAGLDLSTIAVSPRLQAIIEESSELLTAYDIGTTPTDRRMRDERIARQKAEQTADLQRVQDAEQLKINEDLIAMSGNWDMSSDDYRALTGGAE